MPLLFDQSVSDSVKTHRTSFSGADIRAIVYRPPFNAPAGSDDGHGLPNSGGQSHELGALQTLSISNFRVKKPVRALGHQLPMGFVRGGRLIGGHLIFAHLDIHPWNDTTFSPHQAGGGGILRSTSGYVFDSSENVPNGQAIEWGDPRQDENGEWSFPSSSTIERDIRLVGRKHQHDFTWDSQLFGELMYPDEMPPFDVIVMFKNEAGALGKIVLHGVEIQHEGMTFSIEDLYTEAMYEYIARGMSVFQEGTHRGRLWSGPRRSEGDDAGLRGR